MVIINDGRPRKICEKCKAEVPYLLSVNWGQQSRCPICKQIVELNKCIVFPGEEGYSENITIFNKLVEK